MIRKIVIACDSFKGCLSSGEAACAAVEGVRRSMPCCETVSAAVGDGGEGTSAIITEALGGEMVRLQVSDPLGRKVAVEYGIVGIPGDAQEMPCKTAIIESAQASGLTLLAPEERNPLSTTTYGTGEIIRDALDKGCRRFIICLGGSATNDGGTGMLEAIGVRFLDDCGNEIKGCRGGILKEISQIDDSGMDERAGASEFIIACDVTAPFCGKEGAARTFAPQKGADMVSAEELEAGMCSFNEVIAEKYGIRLDRTEGAGAAGGLGGAFKAFLNGRLTSGIDMVLDTMDFDRMIMDADLIITGEGHIDGQSGKGKVISGIIGRAERQGIPVLAIGGIVDMEIPAFKNGRRICIRAIGPAPKNESDLEYAMRPEVTSENISETVAKALGELFPSSCLWNL